MKVYENVVIGNFLYVLGGAVGARLGNATLPASVNLLQQTPEDKALGDILLSFPGTLRLIEFKSSANRSEKEASRFRKLSYGLAGIPALLPVSHRVHWYVETSPDRASGVRTYFSSYLTALAQSERQRSALNLERFIARIASDIFSPLSEAEDAEAIRDYLQLVRWCQGVKEESNAGALIMVADGSGNLRYVALKNIMELSMTHEKWMEYRQDLELDPGKVIEKSPETTYEMDRGF